MICLAAPTGKLYNNGRICRLERCGEIMYSLKNRAFAGMLALLMLLSMTGCAGTASGEESSGSTVTQEEYDALKEQNEQLQAELDELKGETSEEARTAPNLMPPAKGRMPAGASLPAAPRRATPPALHRHRPPLSHRSSRPPRPRPAPPAARALWLSTP